MGYRDYGTLTSLKYNFGCIILIGLLLVFRLVSKTMIENNKDNILMSKALGMTKSQIVKMYSIQLMFILLVPFIVTCILYFTNSTHISSTIQSSGINYLLILFLIALVVSIVFMLPLKSINKFVEISKIKNLN